MIGLIFPRLQVAITAISSSSLYNSGYQLISMMAEGQYFLSACHHVDDSILLYNSKQCFKPCRRSISMINFTSYHVWYAEAPIWKFYSRYESISWKQGYGWSNSNISSSSLPAYNSHRVSRKRRYEACPMMGRAAFFRVKWCLLWRYHENIFQKCSPFIFFICDNLRH